MVIVAAGRSSRLGAAQPKPYLRAGGRALLVWSLVACERSPAVGAVVVVAASEHLERARRLTRGFAKVVAVVVGGHLRQHSVANGVRALPTAFDPVLVHDAARPLALPALFDAVAGAALRHGAAIAGSPVADTLKEAEGGRVVRTVDRSRLWRAETPQGARRQWLEAALSDAAEASDEASLLERQGRVVHLVDSGGGNMKVTTAGDLEVVRSILARRKAK